MQGISLIRAYMLYKMFERVIESLKELQRQTHWQYWGVFLLLKRNTYHWFRIFLSKCRAQSSYAGNSAAD